ncbi:MAG: amidase [Cytophagales bacterium]|nr:amidase [Cytophagales bacterium]
MTYYKSLNFFCSIFILVALLSSCSTAPEQEPEVTTETSDPNAFSLLEMTIPELQAKMDSGVLSSEQIVQLYLDRIKAIDEEGPQLNSVIEVNPDALEIARSMDAERAEGNIRGPMHGIPVMIKDNINTADKMMTTAGAAALHGNYAAEDAFLVKQLRASGAVLIGKTNLSEWANFRSTRSSSGWSSRGGQTRNPYVLDRNPCGSSAGSGAAVSANLCAVTVGTETNGSIVCPSTANGIVGIKPTVGLVSRSGVIPISFSQDIAGPMGRTVTDAAIFLGALVGVDEQDSKSLESEGNYETDYTKYLDANGLQGKKIGVWRSRFGFHEQVDAELEKALAAMEAQGAELIDLDEIIDNMNELWGPSGLILEYEFKDGVNKYLEGATPTTGVKSLADVIAYNEANEAQAMPFFKMEILQSSEARGDLTEKEYLNALKLVQNRARNGINNTMKKYNLDAIVAPTGGPAWCIDVINGDNFGGGSSSPAAWAGYPNISVPAGYVHGLPVGLSFFGTAWSEGELIRIAYAFEQATQLRKAPEFIDSVKF